MLELFRSPRRAIVWFVEASLLALLVQGVVGMRLGWGNALGPPHLVRALAFSLVAQGSLYYHGLYGPEHRPAVALFATFLRALAVAAAVLWAGARLLPDASRATSASPALPFLTALGAAAVVLPTWRALFQRISGSETFRRAALVLGTGSLARECAALLAGDNQLGLRLAGRLVCEGEPPAEGADVVGFYGDLERLAATHRAAVVVVACPDRRGTLPIDVLLDLKFRGVEILEGTELYERATAKIFVREIKPSQLIFARGFRVRRRTLIVKRGVDLVCSAVGLVLAMPLMAVTALAIKIDSPGPVLYAQVRTGALGRPFRIHKFRSMRSDAEAGGAAWAVENDPRVTRVGRLIRKARIDEIPQLWNVLVGEMSLVGPRPERPVFVERLERAIPFFRQRLSVKPGLTGHAQVRCRYGASTEDAIEKLELDLFYIKSLSLWFDLSILIDTVKVVLLRIGSR